jgi:hypothetical protein
VTVPNPHLAHGTLLPPGAYLPVVHAAQGAKALTLLASSPCPGSHTQASTTELPVPGVLFAAGHARHAGRCASSVPPAAYLPGGHSEHAASGVFPSALPEPGSQAHAAKESRGKNENSWSPHGRHCVCASASE